MSSLFEHVQVDCFCKKEENDDDINDREITYVEQMNTAIWNKESDGIISEESSTNSFG